eukprot:Gregarina_sp_Pseudo_9__5566@NODE_746_length_2278_cov_58_808397_g702_i0_p1_GENE_NODE_746_length_2278_cov_58_808397_g702_i0NODE_746_length_2278_cov_58_808397_g702_i0_p1_ORF_typecomplete_len311_score70_09TRAM_LAG1_CLN8/PF03798_16/0_00091DUF2627/PF11118_8/20DUF2627/PF11118_8/13DUF2627/PF11118_8/1_3e03_NODE_746_length_2278_cov_58_808397_g702_i08821814
MTAFIPNYSFGQFVTDLATGCVYQGSLEFWVAYWPVVLGSIAFEAGGFFLLRWICDPGDDKRRAWLPSLLSSLFMFCTCCPLFCVWFFHDITTQGLGPATEGVVSSSMFSNDVIVFFLTFLWFDMLVSGIFFAGHMEVLAGWVHHIAYIMLCSNALCWGWSYGLAIMFIEELPTLLLALGRCYPKWQSEHGFGYTFAVLRLGLHCFISIVTTLYCRHISFIWAAAWLTLLVHLWWFSGWVSRQRRLGKEVRKLSQLAPGDPERQELMRNISDYRLDSILIEENAPKKKKYRKMSDMSESASLLSRQPASP